jgi:phosphate-selective porin
VVEPQKTAVLVESVPPSEPNARLDYNDGSFYLRSHQDNLVLTFGGRVHIDFYDFAGKGVPQYHRGNGTGLKPNLFFRRAILELGGMIRKQWFFWFGGNFAVTQLDDRQGVVSPAGVYDAFAGYTPIPTLKVYFGQYNMPFSMENVTSSRWLDMMERSLTSRTLAAPSNKADGLSVWGETHNKSFEYTVGIFGGDGQNRPNVDDRFDGTIRLLARPFANSSHAIKRAHIGFDGRWGRRDSHFVRYDAPSLSTPGGYAFWSSAYGKGDTGDTRVVASRRQSAALAELYVPFERWDFKGEFLYLNEERREVLNVDRATNLRGGVFKGVSGYGQLSWWILGTPRVNGHPAGYYGMTKLPDGTTGAEIPYALQAVVRGEVMRMNYDSNSRFGTPGSLDSQTQNIDVNAYQFALNYWATKHVRLTAEYSLYQFSGTPTTQKMGADNQAAAPGAKSGKAPDTNVLHELSFRVGLAL